MSISIADSILVQGIQSSNEDAFRILYDAYYAPLVVFSGRFIENRAIREDCVQDLFMQIWDSRETFEITTSLRSYLFTAIHNRCLNIIQRNNIQLTYEQSLLNKYDEITPESLYTINELETLIHKAIEKLPENYRETFCMHRFQHLSYKEIAAKRNISVKTVESHISKSLLMLGNILGKDLLTIIHIILIGLIPK